MQHIVFPKNSYSHLYSPTYYTEAYHCPIVRWSWFPLPLNQACLWLHQWIGWSGSDAAWLLGLGQKRGLNLALLFLLWSAPPWHPATMLQGSPSHTKRPYVDVLANSGHQLGQTWKQTSPHFILVPLCELPSWGPRHWRIEKNLLLCPVQICELTEFMRIINDCFISPCFVENCY